MSAIRFYMYILLILLVPAARAQQNSMQLIDISRLKQHITFLASDSLQGRSLETPYQGLDDAAGYIARHAENTGLKPFGESYFQEFSLMIAKPVPGMFLSVKNQRHDSIPLPVNALSLHTLWQGTEGELVFSGFGPASRSNKQSLKGKAVMVVTGNARSDDSYVFDSHFERLKANRLFDQGADAVILVLNPSASGKSSFTRIANRLNRPRYFMPDKQKVEKPLLLVTPESADILLGEKGKFEKLLKQFNENTHESVSIDSLKISVEPGGVVSKYQAKNVAAYIEGNHPSLKKECIVLMAHYDHIGLDAQGQVFNGADDNASGVAALLETAKAMAAAKPARTVIFLWVTAEEFGLFGSGYYVENPLFPLENTAACINLDMVGRVFEPRDSVWNKSPKQVKGPDEFYLVTNEFSPGTEAIADSIAENMGLVPDKSLPGYFLRSSDHYHFHRKKIPIVNLATGYHADYHKITDDESRINYEKLKRMTGLTFRIASVLASEEYKTGNQ